MSADQRYTLTFLVNNEVTCVLENIPAHEVYKSGVPTEALLDIEGNRWHTLSRDYLRSKMILMYNGEMIPLAYQEPPLNPEMDTEIIYLSKN
uniref:Uncharacterized protein n=1 Tax=viral metagenome TaxID=1070528 RepID=A0A6C0KMB2_9ZZZZ